jgi:hypothetical protein
MQGRVTFGTMLSLIIDWGLMPSFAPINPNYGISLEKAREKVPSNVHFHADSYFFQSSQPAIAMPLKAMLCRYSWPFGTTRRGHPTCEAENSCPLTGNWHWHELGHLQPIICIFD